jgi:hypothetical protein
MKASWLVYRENELGPSRSFDDKIEVSEYSQKATTLPSGKLDSFRRKYFQPSIIGRNGDVIKKLNDANDLLSVEKARVDKGEITADWHEARNREFISLLGQTSDQAISDQHLNGMLEKFIASIR